MHSVYKVILVIVLLVVIFELFQALYFMIKDKGRGKRTVWALTRRISLSLILLGLIVLGLWMGWISPHGIGG